MKTKFFNTFVLIALLFASCRKDIYSEGDLLNQNNNFSLYLKKLLKIQSDPEHLNNLSSLEILMLLKNSAVYDLDESTKVEIVPLKSKPNYIKDNSGEGEWYIVYRYRELTDNHYTRLLNLRTASRNQTNQQRTESIIKQVRNELPEEGAYTYYSIGGRYLYEEQYEDYTLTKNKIVLPDLKSPNQIWPKGNPNRIVVNSECIDWYLVTTVRLSDGTYYTEETYLTTTCGGSSACSPGGTDETDDPNCDPDLGGGDGGGERVEIRSEIVDWIVRYNPNGQWQVKSYERLTGEISSSQRKFLSADHIESVIFSKPVTPGVPFATYKEIIGEAKIINEIFAQATVFGKITHWTGETQEIYNSKGISIFDVFK